VIVDLLRPIGPHAGARREQRGTGRMPFSLAPKPPLFAFRGVPRLCFFFGGLPAPARRAAGGNRQLDRLRPPIKMSRSARRVAKGKSPLINAFT